MPSEPKMPEFYPRVEVKMDRELRSKIERLKTQLRSKGVKGISTSRICEEIIRKFFEDGSVLEEVS